MINKFNLIDFITESNAIENIFLPKKDFSTNIFKKVSEITGQLEAFSYADNLINYPIRPEDIKSIHYLLCRKILEPQYVGCYREIDVKVGKYKKVKPYLIFDLMNKFCDMFNREEDPLECHYFFECVHPFFDFNGRTGRILLIIQQQLQGLPKTIIKYNEREKYYNNIRRYEKKEFKKITFKE